MVVAATFLAAGLLGCDGSEPAGSRAVADREAPLATAPRPAPRILALGVELGSVLAEMGVAPRIVGADAPCLALPALAGAVDLGSGTTLSLERARALRPDLVLALAADDEPEARFARALASERVASHVFAPRDANEVVAAIHRLGGILDRPLRAAAIASRTTRAVAEIATRRDGRTRVSVAWLLESDPPIAVGATGALHELLELAGGENAFHEPSGERIATTVAALHERAPDVVLGTPPFPPGLRGVAVAPELSRLPFLALATRVGALHALLYPGSEQTGATLSP